ncbi:hypothetical protein HHK36_026999 [Tetracentron sinense]|uniref:Response regulatory domain-containing protein n=1 Tax=Tetracentron sinense TaxID=13715 RepID=A0A835D2Q9_TETSI|nr:hypothetical protein HHK36_026999 [Tetracentron sinense]
MKSIANEDLIGSKSMPHGNDVCQGPSSHSLNKKVTALVVEDNVVNQMIHKRLLSNLGIETQVVENGKEAVDLHHSGAVFDLILMDMEMPIMNGPEATRVLRAMGVRSKIVGVTAYSGDYEKRVFMDAGLDDYYEKPLTMAKLVSLLQELVDNN